MENKDKEAILAAIPKVGDDEIWKVIPNFFEKYYMSNYGRIYSFKTDRIMRLKYNNDGYVIMALNNGMKCKAFAVSRMVGFLFVDGYFEGAEINHIDLDKNNNYYKNLEWTDRRGNMKHAKENGRMSRRWQAENIPDGKTRRKYKNYNYGNPL